jgi:hypothetical protein
MSQLHKGFSSDQIKEAFDRYLQNEMERKYIRDIPGIKKRGLFIVLKHYK